MLYSKKDVLYDSGGAKAIYGAESPVAEITLKPGKRYLILGHTTISVSTGVDIMSANFIIGNENNVDIYGKSNARSIGTDGGGCSLWMYVICKQAATIKLSGYGYTDINYTYSGSILGIEL